MTTPSDSASGRPLFTVTVSTSDGGKLVHGYPIPDDPAEITKLVDDLTELFVDVFVTPAKPLQLRHPVAMYNCQHIVRIVLDVEARGASEEQVADVKEQIGFLASGRGTTARE